MKDASWAKQYMTVEMPKKSGLIWVVKLVRFVWLPIVLSVLAQLLVSQLYVWSSSFIGIAAAEAGQSDSRGISLPAFIMDWLSKQDSTILWCFILLVITVVVQGVVNMFETWTQTWIHLSLNKRVTPQTIKVSLSGSFDNKLDASTAVQRWLLKSDIAYLLKDVISNPIGAIGSIIIAMTATYKANSIAGHIAIAGIAIWIFAAIPLFVQALRASKNSALAHEKMGRTIRNSVALKYDLSRPSLLNWWLKKTAPSVEQLQRVIAKQGLWRVIMEGSLSTIASIIPYVATIFVIASGNMALAIVIVLYLVRLSGPLGRLAGVLGWNQDSIVSAQRIADMLGKSFTASNGKIEQFEVRSNLELKNWVATVGDNDKIAYPDILATNESILCFSGPSGCGKSTLLKSIACMQKITTGELLLDGQKIDIESASWRETCSMLPQEPELIPRSIRDNLMDFADWSSNEFITKAIDKIINAVEGAEDCIVDVDNKGVSVGQRRCIALLRCLGCSSKVVLLDEPIAGMDDSLVSVLRDVIENARRQGRIIILAAHEHDFERLKLEKGKMLRLAHRENITAE
jgi:ABC-type bacteriocin/lantibiotic exporter with double-glycine peptidase domain